MKTLDFGSKRLVRLLKTEIGDTILETVDDGTVKTRKVVSKKVALGTSTQLSTKAQYDLLCKIHYDRPILESEKADVMRIRQEITRKINGYKQQDVKRKLFDAKALVKTSEVVQKLVDGTMMCVFCNKQVLLLFDKVRDMAQWSLDRIDNDIGHSASNTNICCLKCNLERRRQNYDAFHWTKNLTISKEECADEKPE